jgi:hypothetical protein
MQRRLLDVIAALGESTLKLADRVTALEQGGAQVLEN